MLFDLHQDCEVPMKLLCNNKGTTSIANSSVQHGITKQVEIDGHFIKEKLHNGSICIPYIPQVNRLLIFSQRGFLYRALSLALANWVFLTFTPQLEGEWLELVGW